MKLGFGLLAGVLLITSLEALAVPRGAYLVSPKKITVSGNQVQLQVVLPCRNESPDEWAGNLVALSDDEGDMAVGLAVVLAKSSCTPGPRKTFTLEYELAKTGLTIEDLKQGAVLQPLDLKK